MKDVIFCGTSLLDLRVFPSLARKKVGKQLERVQNGMMPTDWRPMPEIGMGVVEIRVADMSGAFRVIDLAKLRDKIAVLHCFQKKTQRTAPADLALARKRYIVWIKGNDDEI